MRTLPLLVFYDSWCPLCRRAMKTIQKHDTHQVIQFISFREDQIMDQFDLWDKDVEKKIYAIDPNSIKSYSGIYTLYQVAHRIPLFRISVPFIFLSIKLGLGERVYRYISEKRKIVPVGQCEGESCSLFNNHKEQ
ncbi:putative DCC family thiol-disulfide oxidoreductase YuxK [Pullulanibacillus pueri]|uniref:Thioredoxin n=1 Tax=Pullulanibacillus pueri TaxID=1437324 RepID=A0A8J3EMM8_9BACL|nr:DUF393 domain-containing protein [Pullulanibacillus pueri]MBM7680653.1 putative DCC family thiol-disulfide oxidoreductase YuxK [Pullulanibacillus pueri]GGH83839.1 thioredoxin [Pullulanibacillus pueri]